MKPKPKRDVRKERFWRKNLALLAESGLTQAEFCRQRGLTQCSLSWWKREILDRDRKRSLNSARANPSPFVQISNGIETPKVVEDVDSPVAEIDLERRTVRIFKGAGVETLRAIVSAFREISQ